VTVSPRRESPATRTHGALAYAADGVSTDIGECSWPWCSDVSETTTRKDADPVKTYVLGLHPQEHHFVHTVYHTPFTTGCGTFLCHTHATMSACERRLRPRLTLRTV